jgi:ABC-type phosphate transport system substrate-binding protein
VIEVVADPHAAQLVLRLGQPTSLIDPAYQIATEDILVVVHPQVGVGSLSGAQVRALFLGQVANWKEAGGNDLPVQVWVYAAGEDVQQIFQQTVLLGGPVTSLARLAVSAQDMSDSVGATPGSVGVLTRHWKAGNTREAFLAASVPVLAITPSQPQGAVQALIGCLQKQSLAPTNLFGYKRPV